MEALKFRVHSPEHSKAIQERLFELGYEWVAHGRNANYTDKPFIFVERNGILLYSNDVDEFNTEENKEATLDYLYKMDAPVVIKLNGTYEAKYCKGKDYVEVGCQKISIDKVKELYNIINK